MSWFEHHQGFLSFIQALVALVAIGTALFLPAYQQSRDSFRRLKSYRNVASMAVRLIRHTNYDPPAKAEDVIVPTAWDSCREALRDLAPHDVHPTHLMQYFVSIEIAIDRATIVYRSDKENFHMERGHLVKRDEMITWIATQAEIELEKIDAYLRSKRTRFSNDGDRWAL